MGHEVKVLLPQPSQILEHGQAAPLASELPLDPLLGLVPNQVGLVPLASGRRLEVEVDLEVGWPTPLRRVPSVADIFLGVLERPEVDDPVVELAGLYRIAVDNRLEQCVPVVQEDLEEAE